MVSLGAALGVVVIALRMVLTPDPNMMYLVSTSLVQGVAAGVIALCGVITGFLVYLTATVVGLSIIFRTVPEAFVVLKVAGAVYAPRHRRTFAFYALAC